MRRRTRLTVAAALALVVVLLVCGAGAWLWWAPKLVRERVVAAAASRGLAADVVRVALHRGGVTLDGLTLRARDGGLRASVEEIDVAGSLWALASRGRRGADRVAVRGVDAELDVSEPGLPASLRALMSVKSQPSQGALTEP